MAEEKKVLNSGGVQSIINKIGEMISMGSIVVPSDYSPENAIWGAYYKIIEIKVGKEKKPAVEVCTADSIFHAMQKMIIDGLTPLKNQCSFIVYGSAMTYSREYQGMKALAKRYSKIKDVIAREIYEGDDYITEVLGDGRKILKCHNQPLENQDNAIIGGYCIIIDNEGKEQLTEMTIKKIRTSWGQGQTYKDNKPEGSNKSVHDKFEDEMVKKTVTNRACKPYINSSNDEAIMPENKQLDNTETSRVALPEKPKTTAQKKLPPQPPIQDAEIVNEEKKGIPEIKEEF